MSSATIVVPEVHSETVKPWALRGSIKSSQQALGAHKRTCSFQVPENDVAVITSGLKLRGVQHEVISSATA